MSDIWTFNSFFFFFSFGDLESEMHYIVTKVTTTITEQTESFLKRQSSSDKYPLCSRFSDAGLSIISYFQLLSPAKKTFIKFM